MTPDSHQRTLNQLDKVLYDLEVLLKDRAEATPDDDALDRAYRQVSYAHMLCHTLGATGCEDEDDP